MKLVTRILLAIMAVGVFAISAQAKGDNVRIGGGGTGEVIIISG